jgi:hypothetical protein
MSTQRERVLPLAWLFESPGYVESLSWSTTNFCHVSLLQGFSQDAFTLAAAVSKMPVFKDLEVSKDPKLQTSGDTTG